MRAERGQNRGIGLYWALVEDSSVEDKVPHGIVDLYAPKAWVLKKRGAAHHLSPRQLSHHLRYSKVIAQIWQSAMVQG
jgi:hypothetical protein